MRSVTWAGIDVGPTLEPEGVTRQPLSVRAAYCALTCRIATARNSSSVQQNADTHTHTHTHARTPLTDWLTPVIDLTNAQIISAMDHTKRATWPLIRFKKVICTFCESYRKHVVWAKLRQYRCQGGVVRIVTTVCSKGTYSNHCVL